MFTQSMGWRLQAWFAFLLLCALTGLAVVAYRLHWNNRFSQIDEELERRVGLVSSEIRRPPPFFERLGRGVVRDKDEMGRGWPPPRPVGPGPGEGGGPHEFPGGPKRGREVQLSEQLLAQFDAGDASGFYFSTWTRGGSLLRASTNAPAGLELPVRNGKDTRTHIRSRGELREAYHFTELGDCVLVGRSVRLDQAAIRRFGVWLVLAGAVVLAVGVGGGWILTTRALQPIHDISAAAKRISEGNLAERITTGDSSSELGRLGAVLNSTFARLDAAFSQQRQFTADASHELRTPIAVLIAETQATLSRERSREDYRETVQECLATAQEMRRLTDSLLELARFDAGQEPLTREVVDLRLLVEGRIQSIRPLAEARGLRLELDCDEEAISVNGNQDRLGQVMTNLLSNAVNYNRAEGWIRVTIRREGRGVAVAVADSGIGIRTEELPRVFERFYRADKARGRSMGCSGLGLAICKAIVDSHGGRIAVESREGEGTTFAVWLPGDGVAAVGRDEADG